MIWRKYEIGTINGLEQWIEFFNNQYKRSEFEKIPLLILFNKTDLNPLFDVKNYEDLFKSTVKGLNVKFGAVSAKTGMGINDNFSWMVKRIKITPT